MPALDKPIFTKTYSDSRDFIPISNSAYIYGVLEERSEQSPGWVASAPGVRFIKIVEDSGFDILTSITGSSKLSLRSSRDMHRIADEITEDVIYIDFTGLSHNVWAPLVRLFITCEKKIVAIYVEPKEYALSRNPIDGEIFDLSEKIDGISPIPGFVSLREGGDNVVCIPLLGFEGARFAFLFEEIDPPGDRVYPIIGVPGFRCEYPFYTYHGNILPLQESRSWKNVRFARANCPFSLFYAIDEISNIFGGAYLKIAPIGTKPHALGAILYKLFHPRRVEIVYDHPKRRVKRTSGSASRHLYFISDFAKSFAS